MPDIFLSYSRDDQPTARLFAEGLEREGFSVWWDQTLDAGENFDKVTEKALKEAKAVVVLWSRKSVDSKWVRSEATQADRYGTLVPVTIEPCDRPIMFELNHTADLSGWNGDPADARWRTFVAGLKRSVDKGDTSPAAVPASGAAPPTNAPRTRHVRRAAIFWGIAALLAIAAGLYIYFHSHGTGVATSIEPSIAVLPFKNFSADPNQDYFADGITEEILNSLAGIPDPNLKVTARTSSFAYKDKDIDPRKIGETLGVANILEGSVRKDGDQLRITAQLIDAKTGYHRWSKQYDKPLSGIFAIQEEIARSVAESLQISLGVGELGRQPYMTRNVDAYDAYLAGNRECRQNSADGEHLCIDRLESAIKLDPGFVIAWQMLHDTYSTARSAIFLHDVPADLRQKKAEAALNEVRRLAPDSYIVHQILWTRAYGRGAWSEARKELAQATAKASALGIQLGADAALPKALGRFRDAIPILEQQRARDPLSSDVAVALAEAYLNSGDFPKAFAEYDRGLPLAGSEAFLVGGTLVAALGTRDRAQIDRRIELVLGKFEEPVVMAMKPLIDQPQVALAELHAYVRGLPPGNELQVAILVPHWLAYFGDAEGALAIISSRSKQFPPDWALMSVWRPVMRDVRKLPGFKQLMRDLGVVEQWREFGWPDLCKPVGADDFECT
jgi:TolB-like protein/tetratricopeptide (TPR) repeat protein